MSVLHLQSEEALYFYLRRFLNLHPLAAYLDGAKKKPSKKKVVLVFEFSVTGKKYRLFNTTTRTAVEYFCRLVQDIGSASLAFQWDGKNPKGTPVPLIPYASQWDCSPYQDRTHRNVA